MSKRGLCKKRLADYVGSFVMTKRLSEVNYRIARLTGSGRRSSKTEVTHVARLKPFTQRPPS